MNHSEEKVGGVINCIIRLYERAHALPEEQAAEVEKLARHLLLRVRSESPPAAARRPLLACLSSAS